jgi:hypothetical protein
MNTYASCQRDNKYVVMKFFRVQHNGFMSKAVDEQPMITATYYILILKDFGLVMQALSPWILKLLPGVSAE